MNTRLLIEAIVQIEILSKKPPSLRLTLSGDEIKHLRMALERATFVDTPPLDQKAIYNFAADLLNQLETLGQSSEPRP